MELLAGRYEVLGAIAAGGMATVHLGRAVAMGGFERLVAIKLMHPHLAQDPDFVAMFLDEARLAARIRHPNVVATLDVQQSDEGLFLVMDYVEGCSLTTVLRELGARGRPLPLDVAVRVLVDVLAGLHAAHELRGGDGQPLHLVHRDVSPANILVGADGIARLTDFGVARAEERISSTRGGELKGKVPYMPPEQLRAEPVDRRVDVYAAGVVLWEALVGQRLFRAPNEGALLTMILDGAQRSPREIRRDLPEAIDRVCMRALDRNAADRFPTAAAFADALEQAAVQAGVGVATTRTVAGFIENLGVARSAEEGLSQKRDLGDRSTSGISVQRTEPSSALRSAARLARQATAAPEPDRGEPGGRIVPFEPRPSEPSGPDPLPGPDVSSARSLPTSGATAMAAAADRVEPAKAQRRWWLVLLGAGVLAAAVGAVVLLVPRADLPGPGRDAASADTARSGSSDDTLPPNEADRSAASPVPAPTALAAASSADAQPAVSSAATAAASAHSGTGLPQPGRAPTPPRGPQPPTPPPTGAASTSARPSPTSFRPTTL